MIESVVSKPFCTLGVGIDFVSSLFIIDTLSDGLCVRFRCASGVGSDSGVHFLVELLEFHALESLFPLRELLVEFLGRFFLELVVVCLNVATEDVLSVLFGVEGLLGFLLVDDLTTLVGDDLSLGDVRAGESLLLVGDVETTIGSTLHGSEDTVSSGGADETNIEVSLEWASLLHVVTDGVVRTVNLLVALVHVSETLVSQESTGAEETSAVSGSVVGVASFESVSLKLSRVSSGDALVSLKSVVDNLGDYAFVGAADAESVLTGLVLVLLLED